MRSRRCHLGAWSSATIPAIPAAPTLITRTNWPHRLQPPGPPSPRQVWGSGGHAMRSFERGGGPQTDAPELQSLGVKLPSNRRTDPPVVEVVRAGSGAGPGRRPNSTPVAAIHRMAHHGNRRGRRTPAEETCRSSHGRARKAPASSFGAAAKAWACSWRSIGRAAVRGPNPGGWAHLIGQSRSALDRRTRIGTSRRASSRVRESKESEPDHGFSPSQAAERPQRRPLGARS